MEAAWAFLLLLQNLRTRDSQTTFVVTSVVGALAYVAAGYFFLRITKMPLWKIPFWIFL